MITNFDENLGRLQSILKSQGIDDDTIIVFTTDDGTTGYAAQFDKEGRALNTGFNMGQREVKDRHMKVDIVCFHLNGMRKNKPRRDR